MTTTTTTQETTRALYHTRGDCRMCGSRNLVKIWSFGETPLANEYVDPTALSAGLAEPLAPLDVYACEDCHLVQMRDVVDPKVLFGNYLYVSSTSPSFVAHFEDYAGHVIERFGLTTDDLVVDVGSNDGVLLKPFQASGVRVLGVEPAENIAKQANADGVETVAAFFTREKARELALQYGQAKVISANNVFAHTDDVDEFAGAVKELLTQDGVFVFEVQYLGSLLEKNLFDIVYHEHVCYYHVHPLVQFFQKHHMEVFDVERPAVHGGSIRVYVRVKSPKATTRQAPADRLLDVLAEEEAAGLNTLEPYAAFWERIQGNKEKLGSILRSLKAQGKRIVGYGAPAKATTLCYAFGIDGDILDFVIDDSPLKQGRLMPGTHIPIVSSEALYGGKPAVARPTAEAMAGKPDYCVILAWNFADPIMANHKRFTEEGGRFIIPIPSPKIVS